MTPTDVLIVLLLFSLGASVGSFLNVVILRTIERKPITGRSACPGCRCQLSVQELIPLLSFMWLAGRCRSCRRALSVQYPIVEFVMGTVALILFIPLPTGAASFISSVLVLIVASLLLVLFVIDLKTFLLPDVFILMVMVVAILRLLVERHLSFSTVLWGVGIGVGFFLFLWLVTKGQGIGLGDVKLMLPLGLLFGLTGTLVLMLVAFVIGGVVGSYLLLMGRATPKTAVPFGPYLAGTAIVMLLWPGLTESLIQVIFSGYI